ncbi:MAG: lysylphosphatidylglycerol synthase transmembrane domain-containing protein, partial [Chthoniobacterales bacterium]
MPQPLEFGALSPSPIKNQNSQPTRPSPGSLRGPIARWALVALQIGVTVGLLAFFFHDAEFRSQAMEAFRTANGSWLILGVLIAGAENVIGAIRWRMFLRMLGIDLPFWKSVEICMVALFCNTFMLGAAGGDLVRVAYLVQRGHRKTTSLLSIIMDRVSGLGALILVTLVLTAWNYEWLIQSQIASTVVKFVILYQLVALFFIGVSLIISAKGWTEKLPKWAPARQFVGDLGSGYALMATRWKTTLNASLLSLVMLVGYFAVFYCSARAFGAPINYVQLSTIMPAADIISALPISVGGVGVREQVFVLLLGQLAGVSAAMAVSIS